MLFNYLKSFYRKYKSKRQIGITDLDLRQMLKGGFVSIDCGANVGIVTSSLKEHSKKVFSFEPHPAAFQELQKKFSNDEKVELIQKAVSDKNEKVKLFFHKDVSTQNPSDVNFSSSSSLVGDKTNVSKEHYVEVDCVRLSDFIHELSEPIGILKIDIEGKEVDVLNDLISSNAYKKVDHIFVETHEEKIPWMFVQLFFLKLKMFFKRIKNISLNWN